MAEKRRFQAIKGTRDLLPPETELWSRVEQTAHEVFGTFGFGEIRLPIFEPTELFARAVGGETDIVSKEMYSFYERFSLQDLREQHAKVALSRGPNRNPSDPEFWAEVERVFAELPKGEFISLRPEATASVCRAYIEHGMHALTQPVKLYYMGPMFRRERPQKGRYRQFYQIGAEVLEAVRPEEAKQKDPASSSLATRHSPLATSKDAAVDAEVIEMVMTFFARLGLEGVQLDINSIGHSAPECRRGYVEKLKTALEKVKEKLGPDSQRRIETNPLRVLDSKLESEQEIIAGLPRIGDSLCADCAKQYAEVKRQLDLRGVKYAENWRLVRGLDYYMRTTFEITARGLGSQNAVCGGGRYDGLVELLGGAPTKGIGFAIGEDRLILSLQEAGKGSVAQGRDVYIAWMGEKALTTAIRAAQSLRAEGFRVELPPVEQKFGKALGQADKLGARYALILGENEIASGEWTVKTLADGTQMTVREERLVELLRTGTN